MQSQLTPTHITLNNILNDLFSFTELGLLKDIYLNEVTRAISYDWLVKTIDKFLKKDTAVDKDEKMPLVFINRTLDDCSVRNFCSDVSIPYAINQKLRALSFCSDNEKKPQVESASCSDDEDIPPLEPAFTFNSIAFLTGVCSDGFGDLVHCNLTAKLFKEIWPSVTIYMIVAIDDKRREKANKIIDANNYDGICSNVEHARVYYINRFWSTTRARKIFREIDAFIEVSYRVSETISKEIDSLSKPGRYRGFWGEASTQLFSRNYNGNSFKTLSEMSIGKLRIGLELGIRFEKEVIKFKKITDGLSFDDSVKLLTDLELQKLLKNHDKQCPLLFMGYFRRSINLIRFCKIITKLYPENNYILNVFVKEKPTRSELLQLTTVQRIETYSENNLSAVSMGHSGPVLRFIAHQISYSDSNLMVAMSQLVGCGGDNSYFQALSSSSLPFMEKMLHDTTFVYYLLFLIKKYDLDKNLYDYFNLLIQYTSLTSSDPNEEKLENQILELLKPPLREKLETAYKQFIEILQKKHNMETLIKGMYDWCYKENIWIEDTKDADKQVVSSRLKYKYLFWSELKKTIYTNSSCDTDIIEKQLENENIVQTIDEYLGEATYHSSINCP